MKILSSFGASIAILVVLVLPAPCSWAQQAAPQTGFQTGPAPDSQAASVVDDEQTPTNIAAALQQQIADKYAARLDALAIEKKTFEWTVWVFTSLITLWTVAAAVVAYPFGKSFRELRESVREDATATFRAEFFGKADGSVPGSFHPTTRGVSSHLDLSGRRPRLERAGRV